MLAQIQSDMKKALKEGDKNRLSTIRMLLAALQNESIKERKDLDESEIMTVIQREIKQRRNAILEFKKGNRNDLVKQGEEEIAVLAAYLPKQLSDEEIRRLAAEIVARLRATPKDTGKVMSELMPQVKGKADGSRVQAIVKEILG